MSSSTDPQPPVAPADPGEAEHPALQAPTGEQPVPSAPGTQQIPVVAPAASAPPLPPHPGATSPAPVQTAQPTGPVGFVPGLPGTLPPPPPPPPAAATQEQPAAAPDWPDTLQTGPVPFPVESAPPADTATPRPPVVRDRAALTGLGLVAAALVALELGLGLRFGGVSFWQDIPLWSAFATVCAVLGLATSASLLPGSRRPDPATSWRIAAGGLAGLAVFWLLVVLPVVATDRGFLLTAALACLGGALWIGPARKG